METCLVTARSPWPSSWHYDTRGDALHAAWRRGLSPPTQAKLHFALLLEMVIGGVPNEKEVSRETAQARYCKSSAVNFASGSYRPLGGGRPAPKRADASDPAGTSQRTPPARTT